MYKPVCHGPMSKPKEPILSALAASIPQEDTKLDVTSFGSPSFLSISWAPMSPSVRSATVEAVLVTQRFFPVKNLFQFLLSLALMLYVPIFGHSSILIGWCWHDLYWNESLLEFIFAT